MSDIDIGEWADLVQECDLYSQGIINEISPETIKKLREIGSDLSSLTKEQMQERFEFNKAWLSGELEDGEEETI